MSEQQNNTLPAARSLDVSAFVDEQGRQQFAIRDPSQISPQVLAVSLPGYFVLAHLDGAHTCAEIRSAFARQFGAAVSAADIHRMVAALDQACMLANDRYEQAYATKRDTFRAGDARDNRDRWPDADTLRAELDALLSTGAPASPSRLAGIVAPHLDYARGAPCYADAYAALASAPAAPRYVILGTNHFGRSTAVVACGKDFITPLGRVPTDCAFLEEVEGRLGRSLREFEFDHASEHSIELQVHLLQHTRPETPFEVVAFLCPDPSGPTGTAPLDGNGPNLDDFCDALRAALGSADRPTVLIAGADLSHIGQQFGDEQPTTPDFLARVEENDRRLLGLLEQRREAAFIAELQAAQNHTRICSAGCIYCLLRALPDARVRLVRYHQAVNMPTETHVTCAAMVVER